MVMFGAKLLACVYSHGYPSTFNFFYIIYLYWQAHYVTFHFMVMFGAKLLECVYSHGYPSTFNFFYIVYLYWQAHYVTFHLMVMFGACLSVSTHMDTPPLSIFFTSYISCIGKPIMSHFILWSCSVLVWVCLVIWEPTCSSSESRRPSGNTWPCWEGKELRPGNASRNGRRREGSSFHATWRGGILPVHWFAVLLSQRCCSVVVRCGV